jgi:uncharacterized heparinase superfamily protein
VALPGASSPQAALARAPGRITLEALAQLARSQAQREWAGTPLHEWRIGKPKPSGFAARPKDLRPPRPEIGRRILAGEFAFAGSRLEVGRGGDPWDRPSPSRRFAIALHRFDWLRDLMALGEEGEAEALRLTLEWRRLFGRWNAFSWSAEVLERRVYNLACAARALTERASEAETLGLAHDLSRQARHLLASPDGPARAAERAIAAALAGTALTGEAGLRLLDKALGHLARALPITVQPDGGHASRSPQAALELLFDLTCLDEALVQRGVAAPDEMMRAIDRLAGAVRFFTLADGSLPALQGGEALRPGYVAAARASDEAARPIPPARNGYQRLEGRSLQVLADGAPPAEGPWSTAACAQPLAVEVLAKGQRLIVGAGWTPDALAPASVRLADGASTATLGDGACGKPLEGLAARILGPRLIAGYRRVEVERHDGETAVWLEMEHEGWAGPYALRHQRRLYLDIAADELRGEDRFSPTAPSEEGSEASKRFIPFMVRFHLHPEVRASVALDRKSVLLRPPGDETGWWLRNDAIEVVIEPSVYYQDGQPRRSNQVVLRGQARQSAGARIRWKLAAAEAWPPHRT